MLHIKSVLLADNIDPNCPRILNENGISTVDFPKQLKQRGITKKDEVVQELMKELKNHDGLIVRSGTTVTKEVLAAAPNLKLIGRAGTGVDNIDMPEATSRGVVVMNTPAGNSRSAAELTCTMIMNLARHVPQAHKKMKDGVWARKDYMGTEVYGKTLAIIGLGRIGREVAQRMQAFGMKTVGYDPLVSAEQSAEFSVESLTLAQIWPIADYITVHVPLIPQTKNLIGLESLAKCKAGVRIVNVARGGVVDEDEVLKSIQAGHCAGAAFDVYSQEPPFSDPISQKLIDNDKVICTPHLGASTVEAQYRVAVEIADQFVAFHSGTEILGALNARPLTALLDAANTPSVQGVENLGTLLAALTKGSNVTQINVKYSKDSAALCDAVKASAVVGFLKESTSTRLNLINAAVYAKNEGITLCAAVDASLTGNMLQVCALSDNKIIGSCTGCPSQIGTVLTSINDSQFRSGMMLKANVLVSQARRNTSELPESHLLSAKSTDAKYYVDIFSQLTNEQKIVLRKDSSLIEIN